MRSKGARWLVIVIILYMIPFGVTLFLRSSQKTEKPDFDSGYFVSFREEGSRQLMDLDEYLIGIVAAQIPVEYEEEALKAQVLIARTCALNIYGDRKVVEASELGLDYYDQSKQKGMWKDKFKENYEKICRAVLDTQGESIYYEEQRIRPVYCRLSNGKTRNSENVWGWSAPYLVSVDSSQDMSADGFQREFQLSLRECTKKIRKIHPDFDLDSDLAPVLNLDSEGYVQSVQWDKYYFEGDEFRYALELESSSFSITRQGKRLYFTVLGLGHGVGMSQFGANKMAQDGKNYIDILSYYFSGINIKSDE